MTDDLLLLLSCLMIMSTRHASDTRGCHGYRRSSLQTTYTVCVSNAADRARSAAVNRCVVMFNPTNSYEYYTLNFNSTLQVVLFY